MTRAHSILLSPAAVVRQGRMRIGVAGGCASPGGVRSNLCTVRRAFLQ